MTESVELAMAQHAERKGEGCSFRPRLVDGPAAREGFLEGLKAGLPGLEVVWERGLGTISCGFSYQPAWGRPMIVVRAGGWALGPCWCRFHPDAGPRHQACEAGERIAASQRAN